MMPTCRTPVLIVGAGPVGLALAGDLGWRGMSCMLIEKTDGEIEHPKMDLIGVRTMEFCRRWGIADWVRDAPYPGDYPQDYVWLTALTGYELGREKVPGRAFEPCPPQSPQKRERVPQDMFDPDHQAVRDVIRPASICSTTPSWSRSRRMPDRVRRHRARRGDGRNARDRGRLHGRHRRRRQHACASSSAFHERPSGAHLHHQRDLPLPRLRVAARQGQGLSLHLHRAGRHMAHDRGDQRRATASACRSSARPTRCNHSEADIRAALRRAMGKDFRLRNPVGHALGAASELVADSYGTERVFLAGDAVHLTSPTGALGMNTGMQDAVDLGWKLDAVMRGWGGANLLADLRDRAQAGGGAQHQGLDRESRTHAGAAHHPQAAAGRVRAGARRATPRARPMAIGTPS